MEIIFDKVSLVINRHTPLEKIILNSLSFKISEPGIYSFFGNSNSGKSAIGELADALITPTKGVVKIGNFVNNGKRIKNINKLRFDVGYVYKNPYDMFFNKTVKRELEFGMDYFKYKLDKKSLRIVDALTMVGLNESYLKLDPLKLKLNDARKVALACVLIFNPKIIILDEPTIGLNNKEKNELSVLLKLLKEKYKRIIIVLSRDSDFIYKVTDKIYLMDKTRLITSGDKSILRETVLIESLGLEVPKIAKFIELAKKKKNIKLEDYTDIKDLIKGVYRNVF